VYHIKIKNGVLKLGSKLEKERGSMLMNRSKFEQKLVEKDLEKRKKYKKEEITITEKAFRVNI